MGLVAWAVIEACNAAKILLCRIRLADDVLAGAQEARNEGQLLGDRRGEQHAGIRCADRAMILAHDLPQTQAHRTHAQLCQRRPGMAGVQARQIMLLEAWADHASGFLTNDRKQPLRMARCSVLGFQCFAGSDGLGAVAFQDRTAVEETSLMQCVQMK